MRKIALSCFLLCACHIVQAGPLSTLLKKRNQQHLHFIQMLTADYTNATVAKTTDVKERVIADVFSEAGEVDSTTFIYNPSNHNGSRYDYNALEYPVEFAYSHDPAIENMDGYHTKPYVFADTMGLYNVYQGDTTHDQYDYAYDNNNNVTSFVNVSFDGATAPAGVFYTARYNQQNNITDIVQFYYQTQGGSPDTMEQRFFTYNQNQLSADSAYDNNNVVPPAIFQLGTINTYSYDNAGNLSTLINYSYDQGSQTIIPLYQYINTYTTDNRLKTSEYDYYNGTQFQPGEIDSFGYTGSIPFYTYWKETSPQAQDNIINYHVTPAGTVDSVYGMVDTGGPSLVNIKVLFTYDSYNNPVTGSLYFGSGLSTPDETYKYYYETYVTSAVPNVATTNNNIQAYPNPANNTLYIAGLTAKDNATISLINTAGQLIMTQTVNGGSIQNVLLNHIVPGTYILKITDAAGNKLHSQTIIKQ